MGVVDPDDAEARAWAKWARLVASPLARRAIRRVEQQTDVRSLLPGIQVPTLVLQKAGDYDRSGGGGAPWVASQIPGARFLIVPGPEDWPTARDTELFDAIDGFAGEIREREAEFDRVLATVLFTDIVGSTARAAQVGDRAWSELVERHHAIVRTLLGRYRGVEVDTAGDGFFATFDGPARAVRCAEAIRDAVRPLGIEVRAGCHTGEVETIDGKVGGLAVNIGARVAATGCPIGDPRQLHGQGPDRWLGARLRGRGRARAQRCPGSLAALPGRWLRWRSPSRATPGRPTVHTSPTR